MLFWSQPCLSSLAIANSTLYNHPQSRNRIKQSSTKTHKRTTICSKVFIFWVLEQKYLQMSATLSLFHYALFNCHQHSTRWYCNTVNSKMVILNLAYTERVRVREAPNHDRPPSPPPSSRKNSSDLHQSQEWSLAKVGWTCPPQSTPWRRPWQRIDCRVCRPDVMALGKTVIIKQQIFMV